MTLIHIYCIDLDYLCCLICIYLCRINLDSPWLYLNLPLLWVLCCTSSLAKGLRSSPLLYNSCREEDRIVNPWLAKISVVLVWIYVCWIFKNFMFTYPTTSPYVFARSWSVRASPFKEHIMKHFVNMKKILNLYRLQISGAQNMNFGCRWDC